MLTDPKFYPVFKEAPLFSHKRREIITDKAVHSNVDVPPKSFSKLKQAATDAKTTPTATTLRVQPLHTHRLATAFFPLKNRIICTTMNTIYYVNR